MQTRYGSTTQESWFWAEKRRFLEKAIKSFLGNYAAELPNCGFVVFLRKGLLLKFSVFSAQRHFCPREMTICFGKTKLVLGKNSFQNQVCFEVSKEGMYVSAAAAPRGSS